MPLEDGHPYLEDTMPQSKRTVKSRENALEIAEKYGISQFEPIRSYGRIRYVGEDPARTRIDSRTFDAIRPELVRTEYSPLISKWRKKGSV